MELWARGAFAAPEAQADEQPAAKSPAQRRSERRRLLEAMGLTVPEDAALGVTQSEDDEGGEFWLWPDNAALFLRLWPALQTQWRIGMVGATGLDYLGCAAVARPLGFGWGRRTVAAVQCMERAALIEWARQRAEEAKRAKK